MARRRNSRGGSWSHINLLHRSIRNTAANPPAGDASIPVSFGDYTVFVDSISGLVLSERGLAVSRDGTSIYLGDRTANQIVNWTLNTPWDVSTAVSKTSVAEINTNINSAFITDDGLALYQQTSAGPVKYDMVTPFVLAGGSDAGAQDGTIPSGGGICFSLDGTKFYATGSADMAQYNLGTAWDCTTMTIAHTKDMSAQFGAGKPFALAFNIAGDEMIVTADNVYHVYDLSTAWDLSTAVQSSSKSLTHLIGTGLSDLALDLVNEKYMVIGDANTSAYTYRTINDDGTDTTILVGEGTPAATDIVDESSHATVLTESGVPTYQSTDPKFGDTCVNMPAGAAIGFSVAADPAIMNAVHDFTIEGWFKVADLASEKTFFCKNDITATHGFACRMNVTTGYLWSVAWAAGVPTVNVSGTLPMVPGTWQHVCLERYGNIQTVFLGGVISTQTDGGATSILTTDVADLLVGWQAWAAGTAGPQTYMDEMRWHRGAIHKGVAFTPETEAYSDAR